MNLELILSELKIVNSSNAFWQALDSNFSQSSCGHDHGQGEKHFHMEGNFLIAQNKIDEAIERVSEEDFDVKNQDDRNHLIVLAAVQKVQDQLSVGNDFVSQRTSEFNKHFKISDSLAGKNIAGEVIAMPNAKKYLVRKFNLSSTRAKADTILESQETALTKAGNLVDLGFKDAADSLVEVAGSLYKAAPSLAMAGLTLGTAQMVLRSLDDQETANKLRDNIGASTEAAAFFVLVNGILENLSHSFILAAPAFATVAAYDSARSQLKPIYDYCRSKSDASKIESSSLGNVEMQGENIEAAENELGESQESERQFSGSFKREDFAKTINLLSRTKSLINEDEMWVGLRKHQLVFEDNDLEQNLKRRLEFLIAGLTDENQSKLSKGSPALRDSFEMIKAYAEVYQDKNPASGVKQFLDQFCDHFARDAILLAEPSKEAKSAAFYCRSYNGLVSFEERVKESLPHMPTGQQVLLAATVIGALYSASAIYKASTGEEEVYSDYVTNFPDHLFEWLHLDQMYQNMGGGAELTESFKDFFAGFNLAENSTHLGIAVAPFAAYAQMGSKMFDDITHAPANYLAYAADLTSSYVAATKARVGSWFSKYNSIAVAPEVDIAGVEFIDLEKIGPNLVHKSTQTDLPEEKGFEVASGGWFVNGNSNANAPKIEGTTQGSSEEKGSETPILCGDLDQLLEAQAAQKAQRDARRAARGVPGVIVRKAHEHGPNCNHGPNPLKVTKQNHSTEL